MGFCLSRKLWHNPPFCHDSCDSHVSPEGLSFDFVSCLIQDIDCRHRHVGGAIADVTHLHTAVAAAAEHDRCWRESQARPISYNTCSSYRIGWKNAAAAAAAAAAVPIWAVQAGTVIFLSSCAGKAHTVHIAGVDDTASNVGMVPTKSIGGGDEVGTVACQGGKVGGKLRPQEEEGICTKRKG